MATTILVIGESGSGKSTSLRNLNPAETFLINIDGKALPFNWKSKYKLAEKGEGNLFVSDDPQKICATIKWVAANRPDIKQIVIDDFQYIMVNEFMRRAKEKGYEKFNDIAKSAFDIINVATQLSDSLKIIVLSHSELDEFGKNSCKTVGKMIRNYITMEGKFIIVFFSTLVDGKHVFITHSDPNSTAKSPIHMFPDNIIENDLAEAIRIIDEYYEKIEKEDIPQ